MGLALIAAGRLSSGFRVDSVPSVVEYSVVGITKTLRVISVKLPEQDLRCIPEANRSEFIRQAVAEKLARQASPKWEPKTPAGKLRRQLREKFIRHGGILLDADGIAEEIRQRRGGLA